MKNSQVVVPWAEGLHLRKATVLVRAAQSFRSSLLLKSGGWSADLRSVLSILALCATMGTTLTLEASGEDEQDAARTIESAFSSTHHGEVAENAPS